MSLSCRACRPGNFTPKYTEYTGSGNPTTVIIPDASPGDIYLDKLNHKIWYFGEAWKEWSSLVIDHRHPTMAERFLNPTEFMFVWAHESTFYHAKREFQQNFGKKFDPALIISKYTSQQLFTPVTAVLLALLLFNTKY